MTKPPVAGLSKRRLARSVGDRRAAEIHQELLSDLVTSAQGCGQDVYLALSQTSADLDAGWGPPEDAKLLHQHGVGLGQRLNGVLRDLLEDGHSAAIALAADTPHLPPEFLERAVAVLTRASNRGEARVVVGPAFDGGYYLLGVTAGVVGQYGSALAQILESSPMGGPLARRHLLEGLAAAGLEPQLLPGWLDVDEAKDLAPWRRLAGWTGERPRADGNLGLEEVYLHLTDRCERACLHCYARPASSPQQAELSTREWQAVIGQAAELGATSYTFIGGDPFLRSDLLALVEQVAAMPDARTRLFFARELRAEQAHALAGAADGRMLCLLSLDGNEEVNDRIRGAGTYQGGLDTLDRLRAAGLQVGVNTVLLAPVLPVLPQLVRDLGKRGIGRLHLILAHERGTLKASPGLLPSAAELLPAVDAAVSAADEWGVEIDNLRAWRTRLAHPRDLCSAGCSVVAVDALGHVHACPITCGDPVFGAGNVREAPLSEIWKRSSVLRLLRESHMGDREECASCAVADACGGDCWVQAHYSATATGQAGGYSAASPYCGFLRPLFERLRAAASTSPLAAFPPLGARDPLPFDCI